MSDNMLEKDFKEIVNQIKLAIQNAQIKIISEANQELLNLYFTEEDINLHIDIEDENDEGDSM